MRHNTRGCSAPEAGGEGRAAGWQLVAREKADMNDQQALRVGVGGPVGSGKTALVLSLCRRLRDRLNLAVVTNDIYTKEDAEFLVRNDALTQDRILGVETGGCPHTAIREDASANLQAVAELQR